MLQVREDAIVQAVNRLLAEKGFDAMTVDEVAADVGIAKASLYKHFASKEALAAAAMVRVLERGAQLLVSAINEIAAGVPGTPQAGGGYDSWPAPAQVRELAALPASLVSARDLLDLARGRVTGDAP